MQDPKAHERWRSDSITAHVPAATVDHIDLHLLHAVTNLEMCEETQLAPREALEAILEAEDGGLPRSLGIAGHGHQAPAVFAEGLRRFSSDAVMFALNPVLYANLTYRRDAQAPLALCPEDGEGVRLLSLSLGNYEECPVCGGG
jgi:predicted aldo/keto reductase-like oxidoreductase